MLPNKKFNGEINGKKLKDILNKLDYSNLDEYYNLKREIIQLERNKKENAEKIKELKKEALILLKKGLDERKKIISQDDIVEFMQIYNDNYYNPNINSDSNLSDKDEVWHVLEKVADYYLKPTYEIEWLNDIEVEYPIMTKNKIKSINKKKHSEITLDELQKAEDNDECYFISNKVEITKKDYEEIPEIKAIQDEINKITRKYLNDDSKYNSENTRDTYMYKNIVKDLKLYQVFLKESYAQFIKSKKLGWTSTKYNFDSDTGYYDDNGNYHLVSENRINLGNPIHVRYLLKFYSQLKQDTWDDLNGDMKYILYVLEYLIDKTKLKDYEKDVIIWYIDGYKQETIVDKVYDKYGLSWKRQYVDKLINNILPKKIAKTFWDDFEEWFYTFKAKGVYKTCSKCGQNKLANEKYFTKNKDSSDGLYSVCKECDIKRKK